MKWTGLNELRKQFLDFFVSKGHHLLESAPLIPEEDKSLLLINSGMAPLKKYFLGQAKVPGNRAASCQKCIRTPDIERVGKTSRHGTYFEMLGNFSFADYFKREAVSWAWELVTGVWELPPEKLYISVFTDDDEAYKIWTEEIGVDAGHMVRLGREDNFWEIGAGPCGPCSEIYFDRGERYGCGKEDCAPGCDCDRFVEFWNLVFTQFISDGNGHYEQMVHGNIDTGMGLERIACIMQGVDNLFEVDTVRNIMKHIERITGAEYGGNAKTDVSLRVITDHVRSTVFMIGDGVTPSNEGRGYVLRRLLRRAARHGRLIGIDEPFLYEAADTVIGENISAYPYLKERGDYIRRTIRAEEDRFQRTVDEGLDLLLGIVESALGEGKKIVDGALAFKLYDTFGFPLDLTEEIVAERGLTVETGVFNELMERQRRRAREERKTGADVSWEEDVFSNLDFDPTEFVGYETLVCESKIRLIASPGPAKSASAGESVTVLLEKTPFFAESGGQIGDSGILRTKSGTVRIDGCRKNGAGYYLHSGKVTDGKVELGDTVSAEVGAETRKAVTRNHTGVHLLQQALREVLGGHVHQSGSYVGAERARFDFSHFEAVSAEELRRVERVVNEKILECVPVGTRVMPIGEARESGAIALFGEKYGDTVRVVGIGGFSTEFCGGTHASNTGELGLFKIVSESSVAAGVRRIESVTGFGVLDYIYAQQDIMFEAAGALKLTNLAELGKRTAFLAESLRASEREVTALKNSSAGASAGEALSSFTDIGGFKVRAAKLMGVDAGALRGILDGYKNNDGASVTVVAAVGGGKVSIAAACGKEAAAAGINAGEIVKRAAAVAGGSGGGRADFAMAGAKDESKADDVVSAVFGIVRSMIKNS